MKNFIPDMYQKDIYSINYDKLYKKGVRCLLFDLDNTLASYDEDVPSINVKELFNMLSNKFKVIIFSNASKKRLRPFKEILNIDTAYRACKPFKKKYQKIMHIYKYNEKQIACIGDQLMTDILGANKMGMTSIFVNSIGKKEPIWTKINRIIESHYLKKMSKKGILIKGKYYE